MFAAQLILQNLLEMTEKVIKIYMAALKPKKMVLSTQSESLLKCKKHINRETRSAKATTRKLVRVNLPWGPFLPLEPRETLSSESTNTQRSGQGIKGLLFSTGDQLSPCLPLAIAEEMPLAKSPKLVF